MYCIYCGKRAEQQCCGEVHLVTARAFFMYHGYWPYGSDDQEESE